MAAQEDNSLGGEATFAGKAAARPQRADVSLGDERTLGGGDAAGLDTESNDIEVVDLEARYRPEDTIGQGGMGAVVLATDTRLDRKVAIKRILGEAARSQTAVMRFLTEAKAIAAINHPNIVQIYDYGRTKDGPFLIMEFVDGGSLLDACKSGPLPLEKAVDIVCQICEGLGAAHEQGIVHRDIKPANILLNRSGLPKLTDFGLAKAENHDLGMTMAGAVMGTPDFMPPEQRRDASLVDHRSDLWSLAATFYQMVTGRSPKIIRLKDVPTTLQPVLEKALEDAQDQRYQSAADLRDAIRMAVGLGAGKAAIQQGNLVEGQCPACGTVNTDVGRKYCRQCQGALRTPCLQCDKDMPVWDAVCGECGGRQSEVAKTRQADLIKRQQQAKDAYKRYNFPEAIAIGEQLASLRHPRLGKFAEWGRAFIAAVQEQQNRLAASAAERLAEARAHRKAFDYAAAIRAIEAIPAPLRDAAALGMLAECHNNRNEGAKLLKVIADRIKARDLEGLLPQVERAIAIQGDRADLSRLLAQLRLRETKRAASGQQQPSQASPLFPDSVSIPTRRVEQSAGHAPGSVSAGGLKKLSFALIGKNRNLLIGSCVAGALALLITAWLLVVGPMKHAGAAGLSVSFKKIKRGEFVMGSPATESGREENENQVLVQLTNDYEIATTEITQSQWKTVMGTEPWKEKGSSKNGDDYPASCISWFAAAEFCEKLTAAHHRSGRLPQTLEYTLPTEAEWEYACRAGTKTAFCFGDDFSGLDEYGWWGGGYEDGNTARRNEPYPHEVAKAEPNGWGLFDMHGNVAEWCLDRYSAELVGGADPVGPQRGSSATVRGGSWLFQAAACRSASRLEMPQFNTMGGFGFRIVKIARHARKPKASTLSGSRGAKSKEAASVAGGQIPVPVKDVIKPPPAAATPKATDVTASKNSSAPEPPGLTVIDRTTASYEGGRRTESTVRFSDGSAARIIATQGLGEPSVAVYASDNGAPLRGTLACDISEASGRVVVTKDPSLPELKDPGIRAGATIEAISIENGTDLIPLPEGNDENTRCIRLRLLRGKPGTSGTLRFRPGGGGAVKQLSFTWVAPSPQHPRNEPFRKEWTNVLGMPFVLVEPGEGTLGVLRGKPDEPPHVVRLTRPILIAAQEVTQSEYQAVMGSNPSAYAMDGAKADKIERGVADRLLKEVNTAHHPVDSVSWDEATEFCRKLGVKDGKTYRLPTEAEWEWVCRNRGAIAWTGFIPNELWNETAWIHIVDGVIVRSPGPVGSRSPNDVGVYDMFGNVAEWCSDYYSPTYYSEATIDPQGPTTGSKRVVRGGAFDTSPPSEIVHRTSLLPTERRPSVGFRVVVDLSKDVGGDAILRGIQAKYGMERK